MRKATTLVIHPLDHQLALAITTLHCCTPSFNFLTLFIFFNRIKFGEDPCHNWPYRVTALSDQAQLMKDDDALHVFRQFLLCHGCPCVVCNPLCASDCLSCIMSKLLSMRRVLLCHKGIHSLLGFLAAVMLCKHVLKQKTKLNDQFSCTSVCHLVPLATLHVLQRFFHRVPFPCLSPTTCCSTSCYRGSFTVFPFHLRCCVPLFLL